MPYLSCYKQETAEEVQSAIIGSQVSAATHEKHYEELSELKVMRREK